MFSASRLFSHPQHTGDLSAGSAPDNAETLWAPSEQRRAHSRLAAFINHVNARRGLSLPLEYEPLWEWSVSRKEEFWRDIWDFFAVKGEFGEGIIENPTAMPGARFFTDGRLNFAENLLRNADTRPAFISYTEQGRAGMLTRAETLRQTRQLAGWLAACGVRPGDAVAAYMPNIPETCITLLASASLGAVFSSCSMDFGVQSVCERLEQVAPKILIAGDGYRYNGRDIDCTKSVAEIAARLPSVEKVILVPFLHTAPQLADAVLWDDILASNAPFPGFYQGEFNAPLVCLFSSGTTGAPKCIIHSAGGVLLQHLKELGLHTDLRAGDKMFYFTTCGWMMWNWMLSALALEATLVLYEGNPLQPSADALWTMAQEEEIAVFGASAKYLDAVRKAGVRPARTHQLPALRTICSTGSPLLAEGFDYVYQHIKQDVQLASISGGTDIVSCFALGNPLGRVRRGELQCRGLGMHVSVYNSEGKEIIGTPGDLVCASPFPTMPLGFRNDPDGGKYRAAYYEHFPGIWRHGDWATLTQTGGMCIHGRSDATLNPGGVRIGTAEIYRPVEAFDDIAEALAIGQEWDGDTRIILFVRLAADAVLDDNLRTRLRAAIRESASPRHVPAKIIAVADIPRTRSGKISELAVREVVHNRPVKNASALANPEALDLFRNLSELTDK